MEYSKDELMTPRFGYSKNNKNPSEGLLGKSISKYTKDVLEYVKNEENHKNTENKKSKSKKKSKNKSKEKNKSKSKEKSKNKHNSSKQKKSTISSISLPVEQKNENPFDIFLKKRIKLRDDFDKNHSENFLYEKELAFQKFQMNENADYLDN